MGPVEDSGSTETISRQRTKLKPPKLYRVILLNDDYTTMDFVISILETIFRKSPAEAVQVMLQVHRRGKGMCGVYAREIAEAKVNLVHCRAQQAGYPLKCGLEEE